MDRPGASGGGSFDPPTPGEDPTGTDGRGGLLTRPAVGFLAAGAMATFSASVYRHLPPALPPLLDGAGGATGPARLLGAIAGPALGFGVCLAILLLARIDPDREAHTRLWRNGWRFGNVLILLTALIHGFTLAAALGWPVDPGRMLLLAATLIFTALGEYLPTARVGAWSGIRTPWTLGDPRVWRETHRIAGYSCRIAGLITLVAVAMPAPWRPWLALFGVTVGGFVPVLHSYRGWRRHSSSVER